MEKQTTWRSKKKRREDVCFGHKTYRVGVYTEPKYFACFNDRQETCTELHFVHDLEYFEQSETRKKNVRFQVMW